MGRPSAKQIILGVVVLLIIFILILCIFLVRDSVSPPSFSDVAEANARIYPDVKNYVKNHPYKTYILSIGKDLGPLEYMAESGLHAGFSHDIVNAVCAEAKMNCLIVDMKYSDLWISPKYDKSIPEGKSKLGLGGVAIFSRRIDAGVSWYTTRNRLYAFDFALPFHKRPVSYLYHRPSEDFNSYSYENKIIGFLDSWAQDPNCLYTEMQQYRNSLSLKNYTVKYYLTVKGAVEALENKQVDLLFGPHDGVYINYKNTGRVTPIRKEFWCMTAGNGIMTRKDSDFIARWNTGFQRLRAYGQYQKLCDESVGKHGHRGTVVCIDT